MIHLVRGEIPKELLSPQVVQEKKKMAAFFKNQERQERYAFNLGLLKGVKQGLLNMTNSKCAYCEDRIGTTQYGDIEQFRPKSIYWWLAYEWHNLFVTCMVCNQRYKQSSFPVQNKLSLEILQHKGVAALNRLEKPLLLDPCMDIPEKHLTYVADDLNREISIAPMTERGATTIEVLGLNRQELRTVRYRTYEQFQTFLGLHSRQQQKTSHGKLLPGDIESGISKQLRELLLPSAVFVGLNRFVAETYVANHPQDHFIRGLLSELTLGPTTRKKQFKQAPAGKKKGIVVNHFIPTAIEIKNFKSVEDLTFQFRRYNEKPDASSSPDSDDSALEMDWKESWMMLLGENGVGKSSVLNGIALALLPDKQRDLFIEEPRDLVMRGAKNGFIKIHQSDGDPIILTFDEKGRVNGNLTEYNDYLIAYGATRLLPKGRLETDPGLGKIKVKNLFDYSAALEDALAWLSALNNTDFNQAALFLKDLLFLNSNISRQNGKLYTQEHGRRLELGLLSDGYKTLLALAVDMLKIFATQQTDNRYRDIQKYAHGLVLIDEIGTHLHPRWKMQIVERLRAALPKVFFIVTSHEPLCLRGLQDGEITVLKRDDTTGAIVNLQDLPSVEGMRVDQILTSRLFGMNSTIDPVVEKAFKAYYELLAIPEGERTQIQLEEITRLQNHLKEQNQLGESLREELFYYVIDEIVAREIKQNGMKTKEELKSEVRDKINSLIEELDLNEPL